MNDLTTAFAAFQQGKLEEAAALCREALGRTPRDPNLIHLFGLIAGRVGEDAQAERLMRTSIELQPRQADFRANLGNLLRRLGRRPEAEPHYRAAIALNPDHRAARFALGRTLAELERHREAEAEFRALLALQPRDAKTWSALAMTLRDQSRFGDAESAYCYAIESDPKHPLAFHNLGAMLVEQERAEEALDALTRAEAAGAKGFELAFNRGRALLQLYRIDEAEKAFAEAVALQPRRTDAQLNLARIRFMRRDPQFMSGLIEGLRAHPDDAALQLLLAEVLRRVGDLPNAESFLRNLLSRTNSPQVRASLAAVIYESGRLPDAEALALDAAAALPNDPIVIDTLVNILLSRTRPEEALAFIRTQRTRRPLDQSWIAYEATAARLLGHALYRELYDYERFVKTYELEAPPGWSSMAELNAALLDALTERHAFKVHPLDQSLRNGSQTARSLLTDPHPAIRAILTAFEAPIDAYRRAIGFDSAHPFTSRNQGNTRITGAWSVQLRREGFHVNHFHPQGWISSAYYVAVPEEAQNESLKSGWIKFGETRYPTPGAGPEKFVRPQAGRLVLFPSYMLHGTNPIHGSEARTSIAFDALPNR